jgi:hypothetical protein
MEIELTEVEKNYKDNGKEEGGGETTNKESIT